MINDSYMALQEWITYKNNLLNRRGKNFCDEVSVEIMKDGIKKTFVLFVSTKDCYGTESKEITYDNSDFEKFYGHPSCNTNCQNFNFNGSELIITDNGNTYRILLR